MKLGDIVYLKAYKNMYGEIKGIYNDTHTVLLSLCDTGLKVEVSIDEVGVTDNNQPHREQKTFVNILGTKYKILVIDPEDYRNDGEGHGYCDTSSKEILVFNFKQSVESVKDLEAYQRKVLRHEITHAFLYESGLWNNAYGSQCWAQNEEMVDWIAIQEPKIHKAFMEAGCDE